MLLSEEDAMNKLNPYVVFDFSLPGSVRQTPEFADHGKEVHGTRDVERGSPICDVASTSGDRTSTDVRYTGTVLLTVKTVRVVVGYKKKIFPR